MKQHSHTDLTYIAEKWLLKHCGFAFRELATCGEIPDAIGFRSDSSIMIECKATRSDFLADKKKYFRRRPQHGVGKFRFFMCPKDLIKKEELPEKWGLLYVSPKGRVRKIAGPEKNDWSGFNEKWQFEFSKIHERDLMYSALRRIQIQGVMPLIYEKYRK